MESSTASFESAQEVLPGTVFDGTSAEDPLVCEANARAALLQEVFIKPADGSVEMTDSAVVEDPLARSREQFIEHARGSVEKEKNLKRIISDMELFEQRAAASGLSSEAVAETYRQVDRLLQSDDRAKVPAKQRGRIAEQIIRQAARPASIDQGNHKTCNTAALEVRIYARQPQKAARLVADIALSNQFITKDGTAVMVHPESLLPDDESRKNPVTDGQRSLASQLFQIAAANVHWFRADKDFWGNPIPKGSMGFAQFSSARSRKFAGGQLTFDTGERLVDLAAQPPVAVLGDPGIRVGFLFGINEQITGRKESGFIVENSELGAKDTVHVSSPEELKAALVTIQAANNFPALLRVHSANPPFNIRDGSWHFVNIMDFDAESGKVEISNQWGDRSDRKLSVDNLYEATLPPSRNIPSWPQFQGPRLDPDLDRIGDIGR